VSILSEHSKTFDNMKSDKNDEISNLKEQINEELSIAATEPGTRKVGRTARSELRTGSAITSA
jgi:hypothetical protein